MGFSDDWIPAPQVLRPNFYPVTLAKTARTVRGRTHRGVWAVALVLFLH